MSEGDLSMYQSVEALDKSIERDLVDQLMEALKSMPKQERLDEIKFITEKMKDVETYAHA